MGRPRRQQQGAGLDSVLGYAMSHIYGRLSPQLVEDSCANLDKHDYPYDIAYVRWSGHGDNAMPDPPSAIS